MNDIFHVANSLIYVLTFALSFTYDSEGKCVYGAMDRIISIPIFIATVDMTVCVCVCVCVCVLQSGVNLPRMRLVFRSTVHLYPLRTLAVSTSWVTRSKNFHRLVCLS